MSMFVCLFKEFLGRSRGSGKSFGKKEKKLWFGGCLRRKKGVLEERFGSLGSGGGEERTHSSKFF
ncbi:hypothetical protein, partial [Enterococcus faecium]